MYPRPGKNKETCFRAFCPGYMKAKQESHRFKISLKAMTETEVGTQSTIHSMNMVGVVIFLLVGIVAPFVLSPDAESLKSSTTHNLMIYAAYGAYLVYSVVLELYVICAVRNSLRDDYKKEEEAATTTKQIAPDEDKAEAVVEKRKQGMPPCNSYVCTRMV